MFPSITEQQIYATADWNDRTIRSWGFEFHQERHLRKLMSKLSHDTRRRER